MTRVIPSGASLGCRIVDIDLSQPLDDADHRLILEAFGAHGVVCFPGQRLEPAQHKAFAARFGSLEVNVAAGAYTVPEHREIMILSNIIENGRPIGLADAGQDWHTDMSYSATVAFLNVLFAIKVPRRDGRALGATEFADMRVAWDDLPADIARRIEGRTATHDFDKFWEMMRQRPGSTRGPLTQEQRRQKPPVSHPIALVHPISGRKSLYCNPGYVMRIDGLPEAESAEILAFLFEHQLQEKYRYKHEWTEGDVLAWDNLWTLHNAIPDYGPDEPRLMRRCQVMADVVMQGRSGIVGSANAA
jgi:taurine dioxygenase